MRTRAAVFGPLLLGVQGLLLASCLHGAERGAFHLPRFEKRVLQNGLTVYLMEKRDVPLIALSMVFPAGAVRDGKRSGLAFLTAEALTLGTEKRTKKELQEALDSLGASWSVWAAKEYAEISLSFLREDREAILAILRELVLQPRFDPGEFEARKQRLLSELEQDREIPSAVIANYFDRLLFGDHVLGNPVDGTRSAVSAVGLEEVRAFYKAHYVPAGSALAVAGDFDARAMAEKLEGLLGGWEGGKPPALPGVEPPAAPSETRVVLVNKDDAKETRFMVGGIGLPRNHPDATAVAVVNTVFGGRFTSWLNDTLRVERGLTYGAHSGFAHHRFHGRFALWSFTETSHTTEALDLVLSLLTKLHREGIDEKTLRSAKNYMKGQFPPRYQTAERFAGFLTEMFLYGLDRDHIDEFCARVEGVTPQKARKLVRKYFPKERLQFVLIGKGEAIGEKVKKYGKVVRKEIKADGY
ncbi:MAG: M16 family metallopeptidase [Planctomycetota bacterium]|jgi:predicted Zn-dependent peptidase